MSSSYAISILRRAQKELADLPTAARERVRDRIRQLADDPRPSGALKLTGRPAWRVRAGDYRVVYEIRDDRREIVIVHIGHRRDVYR